MCFSSPEVFALSKISHGGPVSNYKSIYERERERGAGGGGGREEEGMKAIVAPRSVHDNN